MKTAEFKEIFKNLRVMTFKPGDHMSYDLQGLTGTICIHMTAEDVGTYEIEYSVDLKPKEGISISVEKPFLHVMHEIKDDGIENKVLYVRRKETDTRGELCVLCVDLVPTGTSMRR
jgi:hypothetical protein